MKQTACPLCDKPIPEYRLDDPYCDCGWSKSKGSSEIEELNLIKLFITVGIMCILQIIVLFFSHFTTNFSIGLLDNLLINIADPYLVVMLHYFIAFIVDFILLLSLYCGAVYYLSYRNEHSILFSCVISIFSVVFKYLIVDPSCNVLYPLLLFILNVLLLISTIAFGIFIDHLNKKGAK